MKLIFTFLLIFTLTAVTAQTKDSTSTQKSRVIKVYTPSESNNTSDYETYKWAIKTDITSLLTGEIPLIGEYRVSKKISVEASAAITYSFWPNSNVFDGDDEFFEGKPAMGSAFRGAVKYYPSSDYDAIEGWFFGVQLFNKTNNRDITVENYNNETFASEEINFTDKKVKTGAALMIGKQVFQDSNITFESFIGIGFASVKRTTLDSEYNSDTFSQDYNEVTTKETKPNFQFGFRIGFGN